MTRFDRRALFASGAAAALLAASGASLAAAPRRGGHLRLAVPRSDGLGLVARAAVFETLTELTPDGLLQGRLATGWQASDGARIWDLTLRGDVRFHDGTALDAEDVLMSLTRAGIVSTEADVVAGDRLRLTLADPDPQLPIRLADPAFSIAPAHDPAGAQLIGTGLYAVRHVTPGGGMVARRTDAHYADTAGWVDRVDIIAMSDPQGRAEALATGHVDGAVMPDLAPMAQLRGLRALPEDGTPALVLRDRVGTPKALTATDPRLAERLWLI